MLSRHSKRCWRDNRICIVDIVDTILSLYCRRWLHKYSFYISIVNIVDTIIKFILSISQCRHYIEFILSTLIKLVFILYQHRQHCRWRWHDVEFISSTLRCRQCAGDTICGLDVGQHWFVIKTIWKRSDVVSMSTM